MPSPIRALLPALLLALGCGDATEPAAAPETPAAEPARAEPAKAEPQHRGRPLPAFEGFTLTGERFAIADHIGQRLVLFFFNPEVGDAAPVADAIQAIAPLRGKHNFQLVGVATGSDQAKAQAFAEGRQLEFPIVDDSSARLAQLFGLRDPVGILGADADGYLSFGMAGFGTADARAIEANLRTALRLPGADAADADRPVAPAFTAPILDSDSTFDLAALRGQPVILMFFLHTCPHCHAALRFLRSVIEGLPESARPKLIGLEITGRTHAVREMLKTEGLDYFPVIFDIDGSIQSSYGVFGGVPDIFLIDREGHIAGHMQGWVPETYEPLMRMRLAKLGGAPVPMLLRTNGFSGSEVCGVCHEAEHETWTFTTHASAFDTLVKHGVDTDSECVSCHVVGFGQPGGFTSSAETPGLEDVGCESCHGRGGPHLSPDFVKGGDYSQACLTCHDPKHSLGFDYATFLPRVSHAANRSLLALAPEEKARILAERGRPGGSLLPTNAEYVGSEACRSCHAAEFETWAASPHSRAVQTLHEQHRSADADCLRCHTTAYGRPGGFAASGGVETQPDLSRVGCESCHGPGSEHVKDGAVKIGTIVSLGDKCDSCVILQICGACHDDQNDPGFEFDVQEKIDRQRHGTIEPGTGKPKPPATAGAASAAALAAHALALAER